MKIFRNARFLTLDSRLPAAEALAVQNGRITAVGSLKEVQTIAPGAQEMDLGGQIALPGFNDSHLHLLNLGFAMDGVDLTPARSVEELILIGRRWLKSQPGREIVLGRGFSDENFQRKRLPTKADLDQISTEVPVIFTRVCGHLCSVNSRALELAGINRDTPDPVGGSIDRDSLTGEPTGVLRENGIELVKKLIPEPSVADLKRVLRKAATHAASLGLTTVQSNDLFGSGSMESILQAYLELEDAGQLPLRVILQATMPTVDDLEAYAELYRTAPKTSQVSLGPVKLYADGSLGGRTAALSFTYADEPGNRGMLIYSQEELDSLVLLAAQNNLQVAVHAIGDAALDQVLNSFERAKQAVPTWSWRPRVVHAQITRSDQLERMARLQIAADIQPIFVPTDLHFVEDRIGRDQASTCYAWKTMHSLGIPTAGGSDCPIESCSPLWGIHAAITRQDAAGFPEGGWHPQERLTALEALELFTIGSAYAAHEEGIKGTLSPGKLADFVVLPADPTAISPQKLLNLQVTATYVGGERVS